MRTAKPWCRQIPEKSQGKIKKSTVKWNQALTTKHKQSQLRTKLPRM